jgi:hypothetical protein
MPCYTIQRMSILLNAADRNLLEQAIKGLGLKYTRTNDTFVLDGITINNEGTAEVRRGFQDRLNEIKRAYSGQIIKKVAKAKRWNGNWKKLSTGAKVAFKRI